MPVVRQPGEPRPVALSVGDLHLTHTPPVARSSEPDWYAAMLRPINQMKAITNSYSPPLAVICNGDVFDKPNQPPELVNFALKHLPLMYAVAGQHDLPFHRYEDIHKSAYWTLVQAGRVVHLYHRKCEPIDHLNLHGFSFGQAITPPLIPMPMQGYNVAVIHGYIWQEGHNYPDAPKEAHVDEWRKRLKGYRVACFGDNHKGFLDKHAKTTILNTGAFMRRRSDDADYASRVGLLWSDGRVTRVKLDCEADILSTLKQVIEDKAVDLSDFLDELTQLGDDALNFVDSVIQFMDRQKVVGSVRRMVLDALEAKR